MSTDNIIVSGARTHNLKNISLEIPKHKVVVFTGVSGSGKSSLVFDTIYTEAQRQLIETFSTFARSRMPKLSRPDADEIRNISTTIIIDQKKMGHNIRSTVGTATEVNTYLRLLFSRCSDPFIGPSFYFGFNHPEGMCPNCKGHGKCIEVDINRLINWDKSIREGAVNHPDFKTGGWNWREMMAMNLFDTDKKISGFSEKEKNDFLYAEAIPIEKKHGAGIYAKNYEGIIRRLERLYMYKTGEDLSEGRRTAYTEYFLMSECKECKGTRLNKRALSVKINNKNIAELSDMELEHLDNFLSSVKGALAKPLVTKMRQILQHLIEIGVGYLSLSRQVSTLSGGESQRVKMARQLDCDLTDMIYILDEPSIGLHSRDTQKLIQMLYKLRDKGNSVLVVEHDPEIIRAAEWVVDIGPKAGEQGGNLIYSGEVGGLEKTDSITGKYLNKQQKEHFNRKRSDEDIELKNITVNNLKNVSVNIPKGVLTCITGVAGSGKSSLINDYFIKNYQDIIMVDQDSITSNIRSNPATYTGVFDLIRKEFAQETGTEAGLFSFNSKGACPKCKGKGFVEIEMSFLDNIRIHCDECNGRRYKEEILQLKYQDKSIFDILEMTINQAKDFFPVKEIQRRLQILDDVGLEYLKLGQPLSTLSGGESQRIKLAAELHKKGNIYVMDEPSTGLHLADLEKLIHVIKRLTGHRNTVVVIEHNLEIIKHADWIIDMGPEGGSKGGEILYAGTPEEMIDCTRSHTSKYLQHYFL